MGTLDPARLTVILVEPSHPGNIGSAARAMANMGVVDLRLVNSQGHQDPEALRLAPHAAHVLEAAQVYPTLEAAIQDCGLIIATSARTRTQTQNLTLVSEVPKLIQQVPSSSRVALVFGRERTGLTNHEMSCCNDWITIPTFGNTSSLNLAQAVMVVLYEISRLFEQPWEEESSMPPATSENVEGLKGHLFQVLELINFLESENRSHMWDSFSVLLGRAKPTQRDVRMIRGFLHKVQVAFKLASRKSD
ncbi:MAG: tRNA (cytosine(32)/uridine(32)-2'-O)-methyltransferase TrmJ [SAR324 cluster bacterium]|uniref:tRNA (cytidine/uridine-2'-O-)-methyltransferase TrmJ n=1 Tax=SAR324 cluster bacterium TaxID=2024889 RepID=A0A2A4T7B4_9DELT|nr:MAG: tRNA (cytosine(32)/uridine(32)-2'-O)-methyltransferase TrmJ [SAR324 cluster bacterium]